MLSDEQMSKRLPFSPLNDEQMSNWLGVVRTNQLKIFSNKFKFSLRGFAGLVFNLEFQVLNFGEFSYDTMNLMAMGIATSAEVSSKCSGYV